MKNIPPLTPNTFKEKQIIVLPTEVFRDYIDHPQVRRLYLTDVGFFPKAENHYAERTVGLEEYIYIYCAEGYGTILVNDTEYELKENEAFCIPSSCAHRYYASSDNPWSILWVHFKGEDTAFYPLEECRIIHFDSENAANHMHFLFELLFRVLGEAYTLDNFIYIGQVLSLILTETYKRQNKNCEPEQNRHITNVIRYMYTHLSENLTLETICSEFEISQSYLHLIFQKYTQHSPMDFFIQLKMKKACQMLRSRNLYTYQIAQELGYNDPYYFSRIFKKVIGVSPKEYRNSDYYLHKE